jgi:stage V sporulation protein S
MEPTLIKVARSSKSSSVAGAIAGMIREHKIVHVQAVGVNSITIAVCAIALATRFLLEDKDPTPLVCCIQSVQVEILPGKKMAGYKFVVFTDEQDNF